jgi:hypothetical protein
LPHKFDIVHVTTIDSAHLPFVADNPQLLVAFYFDSCSACKALKLPLEKAAKAAAAEGLPPVVAVNCGNGQDGNFCRPHTAGFPTLRYFASGDWAHESTSDDNAPKFLDGASPSLSYNKALQPLHDKDEWAGVILEFLRANAGRTVAGAPVPRELSEAERIRAELVAFYRSLASRGHAVEDKLPELAENAVGSLASQLKRALPLRAGTSFE